MSELRVYLPKYNILIIFFSLTSRHLDNTYLGQSIYWYWYWLGVCISRPYGNLYLILDYHIKIGSLDSVNVWKRHFLVNMEFMQAFMIKIDSAYSHLDQKNRLWSKKFQKNLRVSFITFRKFTYNQTTLKFHSTFKFPAFHQSFSQYNQKEFYHVFAWIDKQ